MSISKLTERFSNTQKIFFIGFLALLFLALWFSFIIDNKVDKLKNVYSESQVDSYMSRYSSKVDERILTYLANTSDTVSCLHKKLTFLFSLADCPTKTNFLQTITTCNP